MKKHAEMWRFLCSKAFTTHKKAQINAMKYNYPIVAFRLQIPEAYLITNYSLSTTIRLECDVAGKNGEVKQAFGIGFLLSTE